MLKITMLCAEGAGLPQCRDLLAGCTGIKVIGRPNSLRDAGRYLTFGRSDILIMDEAIFRSEGAEAIRGLHRGNPLLKSLLVLDNNNKNSILLAVSLGFQGVIVRDRMPALLFRALAALLAGEAWISRTLVEPLRNELAGTERQTRRRRRIRARPKHIRARKGPGAGTKVRWTDI